MTTDIQMSETEKKPETPLQSVSNFSTNVTIIAQADSTSADNYKEIKSKDLSDGNIVTDILDSSSFESVLKISTERSNLKRSFIKKEEDKLKILKENLSQNSEDSLVENIQLTNPSPGTSSKQNENVSTTIIEDKKQTSITTAAATSESIPTAKLPCVELYPRPKKLKVSRTKSKTRDTSSAANISVVETKPSDTTFEPPLTTNCYQMFLNIRKQIDKKRKNLFPVQPKPPIGFTEYLMNKRSYVLAGNYKSQVVTKQTPLPDNLHEQQKKMFIEQDKERQRLFVQHIVEKEKLVLSVEQEILRVHGRAARSLANQRLPFSVCTILKDDEVYNLMTPEQEKKKNKHPKSCHDGRLFLSWLQAVDDKWEKIMELMLLRHHNEAESLHAVQKMDWECKLKELQLFNYSSKSNINEKHVPIVKVSDDLDLFPS